MADQRSRFNSWQSVLCSSMEENFVRSSTIETCMRSVFIIPLKEQSCFFFHCFMGNGNKKSSGTAFLERANNPFGQGDGTMFANPAITILDAGPHAPIAEMLALELTSAIRYEVLGPSVLGKDSIQRRRDLTRSWIFFEQFETQNLTREVVNDDQDVPSIRVTLRQRKRRPRSPKTVRNGDNRYTADTSFFHTIPKLPS